MYFGTFFECRKINKNYIAMDVYALYSYTLEPATCIQGNFYENEQVKQPNPSEDRNEDFDKLFGEKKDEIFIPKKRKKINNVGEDHYPCTVILHTGRVVWLRMENQKTQSRYVKTISQTSEPDAIEKVPELTVPYHYIFIDCRKGQNLIAIRKNSDAWRNTDTVARLLAESLNDRLFNKGYGFQIKITPVTLHKDLWDYNQERLTIQGKSIKKMTIFMLNGQLSSKVIDIINRTPNLRALRELCYKGSGAKLIVSDPNGEEILKDKTRDLQNIITIITSNILNPNFGLSLSYNDGVEVSCGKDIQLEYAMEADLLMVAGGVFGEEFNLFTWLDDISKYIKTQTDGEATDTKGKKKDPKHLQDTSAALDML